MGKSMVSCRFSLKPIRWILDLIGQPAKWFHRFKMYHSHVCVVCFCLVGFTQRMWRYVAHGTTKCGTNAKLKAGIVPQKYMSFGANNEWPACFFKPCSWSCRDPKNLSTRKVTSRYIPMPSGFRAFSLNHCLGCLGLQITNCICGVGICSVPSSKRLHSYGKSPYIYRSFFHWNVHRGFPS